jgi:hypothetical protein
MLCLCVFINKNKYCNVIKKTQQFAHWTQKPVVSSWNIAGEKYLRWLLISVDRHWPISVECFALNMLKILNSLSDAQYSGYCVFCFVLLNSIGWAVQIMLLSLQATSVWNTVSYLSYLFSVSCLRQSSVLYGQSVSGPLKPRFQFKVINPKWPHVLYSHWFPLVKLVFQ